MGQISSQSLLKSSCRIKTQASFTPSQTDNELHTVGQKCSSAEKSELNESRTPKKAWINASGKLKRRSSVQAFRQMVNSCYTGKTRVEKFKPAQTDNDKTDVCNRCCCREELEISVDKARTDSSENQKSRRLVQAFRQVLKLRHCSKMKTQVKIFSHLQSNSNIEINDDTNQHSVAPGSQSQCDKREISGSNEPLSLLSEMNGTNSSTYSENNSANSPESKAKDKKQSSKGSLDELYAKGALLGFGGFGFTYEGLVYEGLRKADGFPVKHRADPISLTILNFGLVAIKYVSKSHAKEVMDAEGPVPLEVALMKQINHTPASSHIVQLIEWFSLPTEYVMVLERPHPCQNLMKFCESQGGTLMEDQARTVMLQIIEALRTCQNRGIPYRDFKPSNVLIQTDTLQVKLIDFGSGAFLKNTPYENFAGATLYSPPEWFLQKKYLALPATVWSVGVTFFRLVCGSVPFNTEAAVIGVHLYFPNGVSTEFCHLDSWCLSRNPEDRPTLQQIVLHPWFQ